MKKSEVLSCDKCYAFEENPKGFVEKEICPACVHTQQIKEPIIFKLLHYLELQDYGCPLGRNELTDIEWILLGIIKRERESLKIERAVEDGKRARNDNNH